MANAVEKVNTIAIADIEAINTITDANLQALNTLEFAGFTAVEAHTLISTHTASSSSSLDITSGIDSTYDVYEFVFTNIHPATDYAHFAFQVNAVGGSGFNETITSTFFISIHTENDASTSLAYETFYDQANGTADQILVVGVGNENDESTSGILTIYNPSSTTFVKHFMSRKVHQQGSGYQQDDFITGYINTTAALDEIRFQMNSGNIDAGQIKMYGLAKS